MFWTWNTLLFLLAARTVMCVLKHPAILSPNPRHGEPWVFSWQKFTIHSLICAVILFLFNVGALSFDLKTWIIGVFIIVEAILLCNNFMRLLTNILLNHFESIINNAQKKLIISALVISKRHSPAGEVVLDAGVMYFSEKYEILFSDGSCLEFGEPEYLSAEIGDSYVFEKVQLFGFKASLLKIRGSKNIL